VVDPVVLLLTTGVASIVGTAVAGVARKVLVRRRRLAELQVLFLVAATEAQRRGHRVVDGEHLAWAALAAPPVSRSLRERGVRVAELLAGVEVKLAQVPAEEPAEEPASRPFGFSALFGRLTRQALHRRERPLLEAVVLALVEDRSTFAGQGLAERGIDHLWSLDLPPFAVESTRGRPYRGNVVPVTTHVVFWNDAKSTMDGVIAILSEVFAMSQPEARYVMLLVHHAGRAIVHSADEAEATSLAERATATARQRGMPLRVTVARARASWWD